MDDFSNGSVREKMISFIKTHYSRILGDDIRLLDEPGGLEQLHRKYCQRSPLKG